MNAPSPWSAPRRVGVSPIRPDRLGTAMRDVEATEAVLRAHVAEQDIAFNLNRQPVLPIDWIVFAAIVALPFVWRMF